MPGSSHGSLHAFGTWFQQYKAHLLKKKMLKPVRTKAGLGVQLLQFTTNASESMNAVLKRKVDYKKNELPEFLEELRKVIDEQQHELERAIINKGKYQLCVKYRKMEIEEKHWFLKMSPTQGGVCKESFVSASWFHRSCSQTECIVFQERRRTQ